MDHLPVPNAMVDLDLDVPLLSTLPIPCGEGAFEAYPTLRKLELDSSGIVTLVTLRKRSVEEALDIIQSWLYFTILAQIFGRDFEISSFFSNRQDSEGRIIITTGSLVRLLQGKMRLVYPGTSAASGLQDANGGSQAQRIERLWDLATKQCDTFDKPWPDAGVLGSKILLSVRILHETLLILPALGNRRPSLPGYPVASLRPIIQHTVSRAEWCEYQLARVLRGASCSSAIYICRLKRLPKRRGWPARCDEQISCSCFHFDIETFEHRHVGEGCSCSPIQLDVNEMSRILRTGGVPVVKCVTRRLGEHLEVLTTGYIRATPGLNFVAISHLWADGLGHPEKNTMLGCQLLRVLGGIRKVENERRSSKPYLYRGIGHSVHWLGSRMATSTQYIWTDFLCIPQKQRDRMLPNQVNLLRQPLSTCEAQETQFSSKDKDTAMQLMPAAYSWAQYVLVLDNELELLTAASTSLETTARLAVSGWNSRYWTFQEHMLAGSIYFHTLDKNLRSRIVQEPRKVKGNLSDVLWPLIKPYFNLTLISPLRILQRPDYTTMHYPRAERLLRSMLQQDFSKMLKRVESVYAASDSYVPFAKRERESRIFQEVWNELSQRTTTRIEDAWPILATLLDLDPFEVKILHPTLQMKAVLKSQARLPCALLTAPLLRNDQEEVTRDERWIPTALNHDLGLSRCTMRVERFGLVMDHRSLHSGSRKDFSVFLVRRPRLHDGMLSLVHNGCRSIQISIKHKEEHLQNPIAIFLQYRQLQSLSSEEMGQGQECAVFKVDGYHGRDIQVSFVSMATWESSNGESSGGDRWCVAEDQDLETSQVIIACGKCITPTCIQEFM
jgi:hypothetical protein